MPMPIDIIYVNYNSTDCLIRSIKTLFDSDYCNQLLNVIVVDNCSNDRAHRLRKIFPSIKLILNRQNHGFGAAINQALSFCRSKYIILINPDSLITNGLLTSCIQYMEQKAQIGIVGPMIVDKDGSVQGSARAFPTPLTSLFGRNSPITRMFPNNSITRTNILTNQSDGTTPMEVDWVSGACMIVRREAMQSVGGFDERFFLYWEDADLCRRLISNGWKVVYYPQATVTHFVGRSSNTRPIFANYQFHKSCYKLYDKYVEWPFSAITPIAGIALMLRFLVAVIFNRVNSVVVRVKRNEKPQIKCGKEKQLETRILRVISRMNIGGPSIHVKNLTESIDPNKFFTKLVTGSISADEGDMSYITQFRKNVRITVPELQREISILKDLVALFKVIKLIRKFKPDIIHSHTSKAGSVSRIAALVYHILGSKKIIVIHTFHGNVLYGYFTPLKSFIILMIERLLAVFTDRIIAISKSQKWELSAIYKICKPNKIETIKLGFNLGPFLNCDQQSGRLRKRLEISNDTMLIGIIGRMAPIKNHKMFLDAAKLLIEKNIRKKLKFILVGDGEKRAFLEAYVDSVGLTDHIIFHGWEKNIPLIYADLDILTLTSLNEGTPVSVIEAMAAQVPVITTGVGGIKDLLGSFDDMQPDPMTFKICQRGILCPKDDPHAFFSALAYMIESEYLSDNERFKKAQKYVVKNYSVDRLIQDVEALYERLVFK